MNLIEEIAEEIANNRLIPFAGAGVSFSHIHINWNDICSKMNDITGYKGNDNLEAAQILVDKIGKTEFCNFLKQYFYIDKFNDLFGENHLFLMSLNYSRYYTTNQDNVFEKCFEKYGRTLQIICDIDGFENYNPKNQVLYKFHGALEKPETVVFCKEDYKTRMINDDLSSLNPLDVQLMADTIAKGILFVGYSFNDPNIKLIFEHIGKITKGHKHNFYLLEYKHNEDFANYLKQYNIIAVNPAHFYPNSTQEEAYSKVLTDILYLAYKNQIDFFDKNIFNDTSIIPVKTKYEIEALNKVLSDKTVPLETKITQFRQCYDWANIPDDCSELYKNGFETLLIIIDEENLLDIVTGLQLVTLRNVKTALDCMKLYYKKLNTIVIKDELNRIHFTSINMNHLEGIKHLNLFAQCIAIDELLEEKENIENLLSFIQMCMYSKQTLDEIANTEMKEYVVSIFKKAYSTTTKYRNPLEMPGLWFKPKSYEDILNSLISNIPKAADYR